MEEEKSPASSMTSGRDSTWAWGIPLFQHGLKSWPGAGLQTMGIAGRKAPSDCLKWYSIVQSLSFTPVKGHVFDGYHIFLRESSEVPGNSIFSIPKHLQLGLLGSYIFWILDSDPLNTASLQCIRISSRYHGRCFRAQQKVLSCASHSPLSRFFKHSLPPLLLLPIPRLDTVS